MTGTDHPLDTASRRARKVRRAAQAALLLPVVGGFLLVTPVADAFVGPLAEAGLTRAVGYIFGVWAALIGAGFLLARRLASETPGPK